MGGARGSRMGARNREPLVCFAILPLSLLLPACVLALPGYGAVWFHDSMGCRQMHDSFSPFPFYPDCLCHEM